ncbi:MAG: D-alanyl-D-alanine carboxypeptidase [Rhodospirillales bacterium]|nr:D-alanyl-D-alanine carboxypeptidase [Rhodospirillales bacterium]
MPLLRLRAGSAGLVALLAIGFASLSASPSAAIETMAREAILIDPQTGAVLFEKNADELMPPASMSKIMTVYMIFDRLRSGKLSLEDTFPVSEHAWRTGGCVSDGSTMCLKLGERVKVEDMIQGIIVQSGNDASIVAAEGLFGSEEALAEAMTRKAKEIGLQHSTFRNATGLPDPEHRMTVRDLSILAERTIKDFPEYYHFYSEKTFTYNGIKQGNRNPLLYKDIGVDGLKTGHTQAAGYCLTASAVRDGRRLILVVTDLPSMQARSEESERLLDYGFREFENVTLVKAGENTDSADVWLGEEDTVPLTTQDDVIVTVPRRARDQMKVSVAYDGPVPAPIAKGDQIAMLTVSVPGMPPVEHPLVAAADVAKLGLFGRMVAALRSVVDPLIP